MSSREERDVVIKTLGFPKLLIERSERFIKEKVWEVSLASLELRYTIIRKTRILRLIHGP